MSKEPRNSLIVVGPPNAAKSKELREVLHEGGVKWRSGRSLEVQGFDKAATVYVLDADKCTISCLVKKSTSIALGDCLSVVLIDEAIRMARNGELDGCNPLKGKSMDEWLRNDEKIMASCWPQKVRDAAKELCNDLSGDESNFELLDHIFNASWCLSSHATANFTPTAAYRQRLPHEFVEEGRRFVTDKEREEYDKPDCARCICIDGGKKWLDVGSGYKWYTHNAYSVPEDFEFEQKINDNRWKTVRLKIERAEQNLHEAKKEMKLITGGE